jgi:hypothetical protein
MRRFIALLFCGVLAAVPAVVGLMGNQSFSRAVEVRVPPHAASGGPVRPEIGLPTAPAPSSSGSSPRVDTDDKSRAATPSRSPAGATSPKSSSGPRNSGTEDRGSASESRGRRAQPATGSRVAPKRSTAGGATRTKGGTTAPVDDRGGVQPRDARSVLPEPGDDSGGSGSGSGRHGSGSGNAVKQ